MIRKSYKLAHNMEQLHKSFILKFYNSQENNEEKDTESSNKMKRELSNLSIIDESKKRGCTDESSNRKKRRNRNLC